MNVYRWLDAEEMKPQHQASGSSLEKSFEKQLGFKMLDMLNQLESA